MKVMKVTERGCAMKNRITSGIIFIIFGALIAIGPQTIFSVCGPMENGKFMICHWTAQAEVGIGLSIAALAIVLLFATKAQVRLGLNIGIIALLVVEIAIPTVLIGVCGGEHMQCHALTRPVLIILGIIGILYGLGNSLYLWKITKKELETNEETLLKDATAGA